ncbi:MAG: ATP-binding protein [Desulfobacterales bacterium]|nr:ATP-binding protein [Desulfobacterales bacterium]
MADLIFESIRACVLLYAFFFLVRTGKKHAELCQTGWNYLILGFGLLCFGNIIDITDNFDSLDQFIVIGDTPAQAFLEKMVGFLGGFLFVTIGLIKWIPTITSVEHNKQLNRDLEQAIQKSNLMAAEAEMANVAKSEFLANMSHEIRTPMNGVIGMTNLLLGSELSPEQREFAVTIHNSADALLDIINDILDYSKIEAGKIELEEIDFDLRVTIEALDDLIAVKAQEKGLEYVTNIHPDVPLALVGDPGRLRQILMNLAGNAVKFTPRGEVAVSITLEDKDTSSATLRFSVRDTGIGIPEKKH